MGRGSDGDAVHDERDALAASEARGPADILPVPSGQAAARGCRFGHLMFAHLVRKLVDDRRRTDRVLARDLLSGSDSRARCGRSGSTIVLAAFGRLPALCSSSGGRVSVAEEIGPARKERK